MSPPLSLRDRIKALEKSTPTQQHATPAWHDELSAASNAISPPVFDASTLKQRAELLRDVKTAPHNPAAWSAYLRLLNAERKRHATPASAPHMHATLVALYERATRIVPMTAANRHSPVYLNLWLDLAALRAEDEDDAYLARDVFKHMKLHRIGHALSVFWAAWADLEAKLGNSDKAAALRREAHQREPPSNTPSASRPPNPGSSRRPMRPARRVHDDKENGAEPGANDHRIETPHATVSRGDVLSAVDHNSPGWTPSLRGDASPAIAATPEASLVRPLSRALDSVSKHRAEKASALSSEGSAKTISKPEKESPAVARLTHAAREPQSEASVSAHPAQGRPDDEQFPETRSQPKNVSPTTQPTAAMPALPHLIDQSLSPEVMRRDVKGGDGRPLPTMFTPSDSPPQKRIPSEANGHHEDQRRETRGADVHNSAEREQYREDSYVSARRGRKGDHVRRDERVGYEEQLQKRSERRKRHQNTESALPAPELFGSSRRRQVERQSPMNGSSPDQPSRQSDDSSQATPLTERDRRREQRRTPAQSPRYRSFLSELGPENYVIVNGRQYLILEMVGKGGSSKVFKVLNREMQILALKRVKVQLSATFRATLDSYANEIALLRKLRGSPNIVQLYDSEVKREAGMINLIMEYGDIDLATRLNNSDRKAKINDNFRRLYWHQMLEAVHTIHEARIVHGDLKPANFLIVAGTLKLIDFGIAKAIQAEDTTKIVRDSQIGTPNYMSPEALMAAEEDFDEDSSGEVHGRPKARQYRVGRASDIWSLGCILYQMVYGRTPFAHIKNILQKLSCIQDPNHEITYRSTNDPLVVEVLRGCLQRDPTQRMSIPELLQHPYISSSHSRRSMGDLTLTFGNDPRTVVRSVYEAGERSGYPVTTLSGEMVPIRRGERAYERMVDVVARQVLAPAGGSRGDDGHSLGRERGPLNRLLTPTTSGVTNQASRSGFTGSRTGTGTRTAERYY